MVHLRSYVSIEYNIPSDIYPLFDGGCGLDIECVIFIYLL